MKRKIGLVRSSRTSNLTNLCCDPKNIVNNYEGTNDTSSELKRMIVMPKYDVSRCPYDDSNIEMQREAKERKDRQELESEIEEALTPKLAFLSKLHTCEECHSGSDEKVSHKKEDVHSFDESIKRRKTSITDEEYFEPNSPTSQQCTSCDECGGNRSSTAVEPPSPTILDFDEFVDLEETSEEEDDSPLEEFPRAEKKILGGQHKEIHEPIHQLLFSQKILACSDTETDSISSDETLMESKTHKRKSSNWKLLLKF